MKFHPALQDITSRCERDSSAHPILYHNVSACRADVENYKTETQRESVANFPAQGPSGRMSALGQKPTTTAAALTSAKGPVSDMRKAAASATAGRSRFPPAPQGEPCGQEARCWRGFLPGPSLASSHALKGG